MRAQHEGIRYNSYPAGTSIIGDDGIRVDTVCVCCVLYRDDKWRISLCARYAIRESNRGENKQKTYRRGGEAPFVRFARHDNAGTQHGFAMFL